MGWFVWRWCDGSVGDAGDTFSMMSGNSGPRIRLGADDMTWDNYITGTLLWRLVANISWVTNRVGPRRACFWKQMITTMDGSKANVSILLAVATTEIPPKSPCQGQVFRLE